MAYHSSVLSQLLKLLPRHEFEKQANRVDGKRRSDALSRWSQFVALTIGQLGGRRSLRDIEATVRSQGVHGEFVFTQVQVCEKALDNAIASSSRPSSPSGDYFHQLIEPEHHGAGRNGFGGD